MPHFGMEQVHPQCSCQMNRHIGGIQSVYDDLGQNEYNLTFTMNCSKQKMFLDVEIMVQP